MKPKTLGALIGIHIRQAGWYYLLFTILAWGMAAFNIVFTGNNISLAMILPAGAAKFNTAVSALMELVNSIQATDTVTRGEYRTSSSTPLPPTSPKSSGNS